MTTGSHDHTDGAAPDAAGPTGVVAHTQLAAGVLAARHRGDREAAAMLAASADPTELLAGVLLLAELLAGLYAQACDQDPAECLSELAVMLEASVPGHR